MRKPNRIEPYWYIIIILVVVGIALFIYHLTTGNTPSRVAITVPGLNFDIYWYGIILVSGIALGAYVTYRLAMERAEITFRENVPQEIRRIPISELDMSEDLEKQLRKRKVPTLGAALYQWGLNSQIIGLNEAQNTELLNALKSYDGLENQWLVDAPWRQWNPDYVWSGVVWVLILAVIGARIYHILTPSPSMAEIGIYSALDYLKNPLQLINLRSGGLGIYGAVIGGLLGIIIFSKRQRISAVKWADLAVVGLALGQAVGRWGNFFNQELYGKPSDLPWAIKIDPANRLTGYIDFETFHPAFLYAGLWSLVTFFILLRLERKHYKSLFTGDLTAIYFLLFGIGRILLETIRLDSRPFVVGDIDFGLPVATVVSIVIAFFMAILLIWRHLIRRKPAPPSK
ncbi:MAG: prolipoprotein diacylglyceryl transferase [Candidatus Promineifilaceae bacterium]